ncbi:hypothetical protein C8J56DRAFT_985102 [Mycena floridula]|nr:hypothetical protein C8J56DRAFT_985102 [Mycena floridula]
MQKMTLLDWRSTEALLTENAVFTVNRDTRPPNRLTDLLNIVSSEAAFTFPGPNPLGPSPAPVKKTVAAPKKPDGISPLTALSLATQLAKPRLKQKPNLSGAGKVKWECRSFKNSARTDSLQLSHWVKVSSNPNAGKSPNIHSNARYNIAPSAVYTYPHDEYMRLMRAWWCVLISISPASGLPCHQDFKDRYYTACRKLIEEEEEALYIEIKRLEQTERRFKREREDLLRTIAGIDSSLPDIVEDEPILRKRKRGDDIPNAMHCIIRIDPPATAPATKAAHQPVYLCTFKLPFPKAAIALKVVQSLENSVWGVAKERLGLRNSAETTTPMDLDEHLADDGRAQSVLSALQKWSRSQSKSSRMLSMSVSYVDTSVNGPGRIQRQKRS